MTHLRVTRGLQPSMKLKLRRETAIEIAWHRMVTVAANPDLLVVVLFCVIGLGLTINVLLRHPDFGLMVEQPDRFP
jgi:hypothetical protein